MGFRKRSVVGACGRDSLLVQRILQVMDRAEAEAIYDAGREVCVEFILEFAAECSSWRSA